MLDVGLPPLLRTQRFGRAVRAFDACGSTNTEAKAWARGGAPEGAIVLAEHQTAGRGRLGRVWSDVGGQNVLCSVVLRPNLPPDRLGLVTLAGAVAVTEAVAEWTAPVEPRIKWPNDVLLNGRKCCGMLLEADSGVASFVVLGIGLNVNQTDFPAEIADRATSLRLETGRVVPRALLLASLLDRLERWVDRVDDDETVRQAFEDRMAGRGETAVAHVAGGAALEGRIEGVNVSGALLFRTTDALHTLHAGEVTFSARSLPR